MNKIMKNNQSILDCKHRYVEYFKNMSNPFETKSLPLFLLNICSL